MKPIFPEDGIIDHPDRLILTIYTGPEFFSFSLYNPEESGSYFYKELTAENQSDVFSVFQEMFFEQSFFSSPFRKIQIMNRTPGFAFIPDPYYTDEYNEDFMRFLFSDQKGITLANAISSAGIKVVYQLPEEVYQFMLRSFPESEFIHYSTPVISYFIKNSRNVDVRQMLVNLQTNGVDIFCFSGDSFLLGNYFPCKGLSDALYYILFTWKQLQMNQLDDYLHITGDAVYKEELINALELYIQTILFPEISPETHFENVDTNCIPFELAILSICES
jgi:hypothetical protein